jgi:hypothetical protein
VCDWQQAAACRLSAAGSHATAVARPSNDN